MFGSERYGLGTEDLNHCNVLVRIPANPAYCSLNLAMSVQLLAYELFMAREQPQPHVQLEQPLAPAGDVEHFYSHLHQVLNEIDFEDRTGHLMERLRRLFNRAQLDRNELNILRGILSARAGEARAIRAAAARMSASVVYLDYAATTPVAPEVAARMAECLTRAGTFGNPGSASHVYGETASASVEAARAQVAAAVGAQAGDVVFTSGRHRGQQPRDFRHGTVLPGLRKAHRHGAHGAQVGARSVQGARAARLERHVS